MAFADILEQTIALLQHQGRISYGALKRRFGLDDTYLDDLKIELIEAQQLARDENGRILVWVGQSAPAPLPVPEPASDPVPTVPHGESPHIERRTPEAERRQLTVLFCDLVDFTVLAGQLDPEDLREVIRAYQAACATVIERLDGHIAQYLGDGLLVYFTGLVVVGDVGGGSRQEQLALGETPNMAARLQGLAAPDTVVLSAATLRLVQGYFTYQDLGAHTLKGVATPMPVYCMLGESGVQSRLEAIVPSRLTPLVGREEEVALLQQRWAQATAGQGQVVLLSGEAGIGKSRLVQVLKDHLAHEPYARIEWRGSSYHQQSALYPVIVHLHRLLQWQEHETPQEKLRTLETALASSGLALPEVVPLLAALLSLPLPAHYPALTLTPQRQRQKTLEALLTWLNAEAKRQPVLVIVEDLHWMDPSTLELLSLLIDQGASARLCLVLTARPEFRPPWAMVAHLTPLTLRRFAPGQVTRLITYVAGDKTLPPAVLEEVVRKTDGVPLFIEELTKVVLEAGLLQEREDRYELTGPLPPLAIPATLHDALMARLDRLAAAKLVAQLGAVIGRAFAYDLLQAVAPLDAATLQGALVQLVEAELLAQRGIPPQATYTFKHALIQDAAYQSLLRSTRQQYHQRIAQVLAEWFPETAETEPELVAHHYTEAGLHEQAIIYWQRAGERALQRSANLEAISHLTRGLEVLTALPETRERAQQELALQITLGPAWVNTRGPAAPEVELVYVRACELCRQVGDTRQFFPALWGLWYAYLTLGQLQTARERGQELLGLARQLQDPVLFLEAHRVLGNTLIWLGEVDLAHIHVKHGLALYDPQQHRAHALRWGQDSGLACRGLGSLSLWLLGYPDQARQWSDEALVGARALAHPFTLSQALLIASLLQQFLRQAPVAQERLEAQLALCTEYGFAHWKAWGTVLRGWAVAAQGQGAEGLAQIREGLAAWRARGARIFRPWFLALLAEACGRAGQVEEGLHALDEALEAMQTMEDRVYDAEVYRLKGELLLQQSADQQGEAEESFQQALAIARRQQAKSWELRTAMSLARLWQQHGKRVEARELLAPIYGWFTEGFDTADLQEAKALLEALA